MGKYNFYLFVMLSNVFILSMFYYANDSIRSGDGKVNKLNILDNPREIPQDSLQKVNCKGFAKLKRVLLTLYFNFPHYGNVPLLRKFYEEIFGKVVICGDKEEKGMDIIIIPEEKGYQGYQCLAVAIKRFPNFDGYIHNSDDVMLNWWNLLNLDFSKIWVGSKINFDNGYVFGEDIRKKHWGWWRKVDAARLCELAFNDTIKFSKSAAGIAVNMPRHIKQFFNNTKNKKICLQERADFFYIPYQFANVYAQISSIYYKRTVFLETAVPTILTFFIDETNYHDLNGRYINLHASREEFYKSYGFDLNFSHPFKLSSDMKSVNRNFFKKVVMKHGDFYKSFCSMDFKKP